MITSSRLIDVELTLAQTPSKLPRLLEWNLAHRSLWNRVALSIRTLYIHFGSVESSRFCMTVSRKSSVLSIFEILEIPPFQLSFEPTPSVMSFGDSGGCPLGPFTSLKRGGFFRAFCFVR